MRRGRSKGLIRVAWMLWLELVLTLPVYALEQPADSARATPFLRLRWHRHVGRSVVPALSPLDGRLFVAVPEGKVICLDLETGRKLWSKGYKQPIEVPIAVGQVGPGEKAFFLGLGGSDPRLKACAAGNGQVLWTRSLPGVMSQLEARKDELFVFEKRGRLSCLSPLDGKERWDLSFGGWGAPGFILDDDRLYLLARDDSLVAVSRESGRRLWSRAFPGRYAAPLALMGGDLVLVTTDGLLRAVDPASGEVRGSCRRADLQLLSPLALGGACLTVSASGVVEAGRIAEGEPSWRFDAGKAMAAPASSWGAVVFLAGADGVLQVLRSDRGALLWTLKGHGGFRLGALPVQDLLLLATDQGDVTAYALPSLGDARAP